jgi:hypothetical protein
MDVSVERTSDGRLAVKLQTDEWEVNVHASAAELAQLRGVRAANWNERRSIRAGESAGAAVFWSANGDAVTVLIGHDDEAWDVAVTVPQAVVEEIVRLAYGA